MEQEGAEDGMRNGGGRQDEIRRDVMWRDTWA